MEDVGETGANDAQLEEAFDRATQGNERAQYNVVNNLPATNEEAMQDPRYVGAVTQVLQFEKRFEGKNLSELTPKEILSEGKMLADFAKGNLLVLPAILDTIKNNPDSPVAEAWAFILQTDENLPFEMADVGRFTAAMATDPTTYLGGYGIWSKFLSKKGAKGILGKMGIASSFGVGMGAGYGSLYDLGMQNIEIAASGGQQEFDSARLGVMTGLGAGLGFVLGGAAAGLTPGAKALLGRFKKPKYDPTNGGKFVDPSDPRYNVTDLDPNISARQDFEGVPLPLDESLAARRAAKDAREQPDLDAFLNPEEGEGMTLGYVEETEEMLRGDVDRFLKKLDAGEMTPNEFVKSVNDLALIEGSGKGTGKPAGKLDLIPSDPDAAMKIRDDKMIAEIVEEAKGMNDDQLKHLVSEAGPSILDALVKANPKVAKMVEGTPKPDHLQVVDDEFIKSVERKAGIDHGALEKKTAALQKAIDALDKPELTLLTKKDLDKMFYDDMAKRIDATTKELEDELNKKPKITKTDRKFRDYPEEEVYSVFDEKGFAKTDQEIMDDVLSMTDENQTKFLEEYPDYIWIFEGTEQ